MLRAFGARAEWGVSDLARELKLGKSATHRLLQSLAAGGLLVQNERRGTYALSLEVVALARAAERRTPLVARAHELLEQLSAESSETATLFVLRGQRGLIADTVDGPHSMRYSVNTGDTVQLHAGAGSKAILAHQPASFVDDLLAAPLVRYTENTITDPDALRRELTQIRRRGFAFSESEVTPGTRAVGAAVLDVDGRAVAGIAVTAPAFRMSDDAIPEVARLLTAATQQLSRELGFVPAHADNFDEAREGP